MNWKERFTIKPLISVVMSIFNNDEEQIKKAIESILNQTYKKFEFIIIDDASDNHVEEVVSKYDDDRIIYVKNSENLGLTKSLNKAIVKSKGDYIARMDADDISLSKRFEKQVNFLERNKNIGVLGTNAITFGNKKSIFKYPSNHEQIKSDLILNSSVIHPSVMIRSSILKEAMYNEDFITAQDYELWSRLIWTTEFANLNKILIKYRFHDNQVSKGKNKIKNLKINDIRKSMLVKIKNDISENEQEILLKSCNNEVLSENELEILWGISNLLIKENYIYDEMSLSKTLSLNVDRANYLFAKKYKKLPNNYRQIENHQNSRFTYLKYLVTSFKFL